jgi:hypothetical protein
LTGALSGKTYQFKVEARNIIGYSPLSIPLSIKAAIVPGVPF